MIGTPRTAWCLKNRAETAPIIERLDHDYYQQPWLSAYIMHPNQGGTAEVGSNIGECGKYGSQRDIEEACSANPDCVGYSMIGPAGTPRTAWCLKNKEETPPILERLDHDYYEKPEVAPA